MDIKNIKYKINILIYIYILNIYFLKNINCLYESSNLVKNISASNFSQQVLRSGAIWIIEFYADWCGHCKNFAPEYEKAAKALKGIIKFGAIQEDKSLMSTYNVRGFPTVKAFIDTGKGSPKIIDFNGNRDATSVVDFAINQIKYLSKLRLTGKEGFESSKSYSGRSDVIVLTDSNFDKLVLQDTKSVWFVEFYAPWCGHCKALAPDWEALATKVKGKVKVGKIDATAEKMIASRFNIQGFPTLKLFPAGPKSDTIAETYQGPRTANELAAYALKFFTTSSKAEQLLNEEQFRDVCKTGVCIILFLPHIIDSKAEKRNEYLNIAQNVVKASATMPVNFLWSQGGDQFDIEENLHLAFGYPAVVAINLEKSKYAIHRGVFTEESIKTFLSGLMAGKIPVDEIQKNFPKIKTVKKWDGKDYFEPNNEL